MAKKDHCEECAGKASEKEEECSTCDGTGKLKKAKSSKKK